MSDVTEPRVVTPLMRLLLALDTDSLLNYLDRSGLQFVLSRRVHGEYACIIYREGMACHKVGGRRTAKQALVGSLASFLSYEQKDHHDYGWRRHPPRVEEGKEEP